MAMKKKAAVPEKISEEYYQISEEILSSFSKYRPPVDLFRFRDDIAQLYPLYRKGQRLSNEQAEDVLGLCPDMLRSCSTTAFVQQAYGFSEPLNIFI